MTEEEFETYARDSSKAYADDMIRAGYWTAEGGRGIGLEEFKRLLPRGTSTKDNFLRWIEDGATGMRVGLVWYALQKRGRSQLFIYDIMIFEGFRRRGYATDTLSFLEVEAKSLGAEAIGLHVFAHNLGAIRLYEKAGFKAASLNMVKDLE
jgi:ribosomal protein S18 acetylase RimI-like enzyme